MPGNLASRYSVPAGTWQAGRMHRECVETENRRNTRRAAGSRTAEIRKKVRTRTMSKKDMKKEAVVLSVRNLHIHLDEHMETTNHFEKEDTPCCCGCQGD